MIQKVDVLNQKCDVRLFKTSKKVKYYPCSSKKFNILSVNELNDSIITVKFNSLVKKCILLPYKSRFVCIPLYHKM